MRLRSTFVRLSTAAALLVVGLAVATRPAGADLPIYVETGTGGPNGALGMIGESSTQGMLPWIPDDLTALGWGPMRLYAFPGVRIPADNPGFAIPVAQRWEAEGFDPRVWIIGLGANDVGFSTTSVPKAEAYINSMLDAIGPGREVLWINITHTQPDWQAAWNQALDDVATTRLNLHVFDWASIAAQHPEWLVGDHVHCTPAGYQAKAQLVADATKPLMQANSVTASFAPTAPVGAKAGLVPIDPVRVLDTRAAGGALGGGTTRVVDLSSVVPATATAAAVNLTVDQPAADGYLTAWDCNGAAARRLGPQLRHRSGPRRRHRGRPQRQPHVLRLLAGRHPARRRRERLVPTGRRPAVHAPGTAAPRRHAHDPDAGGGRHRHRAGAGPQRGHAVGRHHQPHRDRRRAARVPHGVPVRHERADGLERQPRVRHARRQPRHREGWRQRQPVHLHAAAHRRRRGPARRVEPDRPLVPGRQRRRGVLDTRSGEGGWLGAAASLQTLDVDTSHIPGVPASAAAVAGTVTATDTWGDGYVTTWPCAAPRPTASTLNFQMHQSVPNAAVVALGADRRLCAASFVPAYLLFDLTGWFTE